MSLAIGVSFPAGRFHATRWGRHVNEGVPEWPPSPWRLIRALVATWRRKLHANQALEQLMPRVIAKIVQPPAFKLPPATLGHTRHYMPWHKNWKPEKPGSSRTLVFDSFVALDTNVELTFAWPSLTLEKDEAEALSLVLSKVNYFGRAESWATFRVCEPPPGHEINCAPIGIEGTFRSHDAETLQVLSPDPDTWNQWSYGKKAARPDPAWNILAETKDLHEERWSQPPGSCELTYLHLRSAFSSRPGVRRVRTEPITVARFLLDGQVLPLVTEAVYVAEIARRHVQGIYGRIFDGEASPIFSGKRGDGSPLDGHCHAFFLPTDEDGDGRLDHLTVFALHPFDVRSELRALDRFRKIHGFSGRPDINVVLMGVGDCSNMGEVPILSESTKWRSITPFIPTRHYKKRGQRRDTCSLDDFPEVVLREETQRRGLPEPVSVRRLLRSETWDHWSRKVLPSARNRSWIEFRRERVFGGGKRGLHPGCGFVIEFPEPVQGPLALGYGCHFGLGLFAPMD